MSSVTKGITKVFKKVGQAIKKVVKSKVFKVIAVAAAIYFTAGAAAGAFGSSATVSSISSALSSIPAIGEGLATGFTAIAEGAAGVANGLGIGGEFAASIAESASGAIQLAGPGVEGSALADFAAPTAGADGAMPELLNSVAPDAGMATAQANEASTLAREAMREGGIDLAQQGAAQAPIAPEAATAQAPTGSAAPQVTGQPAPTGGVPNPTPEASFRTAGGDMVRQVGNTVVETRPAGIIDKAMSWYSNLSPAGQMVTGQAIAQGAAGVAQSYNANRAIDRQAELEELRRERNKIPGLPVLSRDQIIAAASGNNGRGASIDERMRRG